MGTINNTNKKQNVNIAVSSKGTDILKRAKGVSQEELDRAAAEAEAEQKAAKAETIIVAKTTSRKLPKLPPNEV